MTPKPPKMQPNEALANIFTNLSTQVVSDLRAFVANDDVALSFEQDALRTIHFAFDFTGAYPVAGDLVYAQPGEEASQVYLRVKERRWVRTGVNIIKLIFILEYIDPRRV